MRQYIKKDCSSIVNCVLFIAGQFRGKTLLVGVGNTLDVLVEVAEVDELAGVDEGLVATEAVSPLL